MAGDDFGIKIYTPAGLLAEERTSAVKLQSANGQIGILPQHVRYTGLLGSGTLEYIPKGQSTPRHFELTGGFCNFVDDVLVVLADSVVQPTN